MKKLRIAIPDKKPLAGIVHGSVWRQGEFYWEPNAFVLEHPSLEQKIIEASFQTKSFRMFKSKPTRPMVYVVAGNPDDSKAKLFAAYLASIHKEALQYRADIIWEPIFGGFDNPLMRKDVEPTMLILSNLAENSTNVKLEKAKDLLERWPNIPRVVVVAGEDPISFVLTKLHMGCQGIAYFSSSLAKSVQTIL